MYNVPYISQLYFILSLFFMDHLLTVAFTLYHCHIAFVLCTRCSTTSMNPLTDFWLYYYLLFLRLVHALPSCLMLVIFVWVALLTYHSPSVMPLGTRGYLELKTATMRSPTHCTSPSLLRSRRISPLHITNPYATFSRPGARAQSGTSPQKHFPPLERVRCLVQADAWQSSHGATLLRTRMLPKASLFFPVPNVRRGTRAAHAGWSLSPTPELHLHCKH